MDFKSKNMSQAYWSDNGKYQKAYDYFFNKLVPSSGTAETPEGELLRRLSRIYYRYFNDGDLYYHLLEDGYSSITNIEGLDKDFNRLFSSLESDLKYCSDYMYKETLETSADNIIKYIMIKHSNDDHIWNPQTNKLVKIYTPKGRQLLEMFGYKLTYKLN